MSKKNIIVLAVTLLAVTGFYCYLYKDSFGRRYIQISHTIRPSASRRAIGVPIDADNDNISFFLSRSYQLVSIKVVSEIEFKTNKFAHPLWDVVSDSNSVPTRVFSYGMHIKGMHPSVKGAIPATLEPNSTYRLFVETGSIKGEHVFTIPEVSH